MATAVALACLPASAAETATSFYSGNALWNECSGDNAFQSGSVWASWRGFLMP